MGDKVLATCTREPTVTVRNDVTIDWTQQETVRAEPRTLVRRQLKLHGYRPTSPTTRSRPR